MAIPMQTPQPAGEDFPYLEFPSEVIDEYLTAMQVRYGESGRKAAFNALALYKSGEIKKIWRQIRTLRQAAGKSLKKELFNGGGIGGCVDSCGRLFVYGGSVSWIVGAPLLDLAHMTEEEFAIYCVLLCRYLKLLLGQ